jgi:hypothetical protein
VCELISEVYYVILSNVGLEPSAGKIFSTFQNQSLGESEGFVLSSQKIQYLCLVNIICI